MLILGAQRDLAIESLRLPTALEKLTRGEFVHRDLEFRCRKLSYSLEPEVFSPKGLEMIPLWEGESSITGFYYTNGSPTFVIWYVDEIESPIKIGHSVADLVDYLVSRYGEDEPELRHALLRS